MWTVHQPKPRTASPQTITFLDNPPGPQQTQLLTPSSTPEPKSSARRLSISELVSTDDHFNKVNTLQTAVDTIERAALPINAVLTFDQTGDGEYLLSARPWEVAECRRANQELWNQLQSPVRVPVPAPVVPAVQPVALSYLTPPSSPEPRSKRNLVPIERVSAPNEPDSTDLPADPVLTYDNLEYLSDYDQDEWAVESVCSEPEELPAVCTPEPISPSGCLENEELYANPKRPISPNPSPPTSCHLSLEESTMVVPLKVWAKSPNPKVEDLTSQLDLSCFPEWPIARGGFGEIWKGALTPSSGKNPRPIAVKRLTMYSAAGDEGAKKIRKRTARELAIWSSVNHPNILPLMGTCSFRGSVGLVSEWQDNGNAVEWVRANPGVDRPELCEGICAGLKYLHDSGIVHGDLRGGNVMISKGGKPRLIDFGLASITDCSVFSASSTLAGTLRWMAPELQATEGQGPTKSGDMFAFAMTMLELFTGLPPFSAVRNDIAVLLKYQRGERPPRPSLAKNTVKSQKNRAETRSNTPRESQFRDICVPMDTETWFQVQKCWDQNPSRRPSANEMLEWFMLKKKRRPSELD